jgi:hypothetical protein
MDILDGGEVIGTCAGIWMIRYLWYSIEFHILARICIIPTPTASQFDGLIVPLLSGIAVATFIEGMRSRT